jgi:hypothetical protein
MLGCVYLSLFLVVCYKGEYTTPNTKKRIRSSTSTPGSTDKQQSKILKPF